MLKTEKFGIFSYIYHSLRPFHPERLWQWFTTKWPRVVRSEGRYWITSRATFSGNWSQAAHAVTRTQAEGVCWASHTR